MLKENMDMVLQYTKQFIDAAMPVAKQAYEIGLLTLRIDAIGIFVNATLSALCICLLIFFVYKVYKWDMQVHKPDDMNKGMFTLFGGAVSFILSLVLFFASAHNLFNVWLWTKLFAPELWLAHQAIEKILK
jgi:hypothetical protein